MSTRRILALLVVLALSLGVFSLPAGSATLQRHTASVGTEVGVTTYKGGDDGDGIENGDDDRWGNISVDGDDPEIGGSPDEDEDEAISDRVQKRVHSIDEQLRILFRFLVALL